MYADDEDISEAIRSSEVSSHVSKVSNIIPVRHVLIAAQRAYIAREASVDSFSEGAGIVAEGRDITTVVAPDAEVRILLTAREEVRQADVADRPSRVWVRKMSRHATKADSKVTNFTSARGRRVDRRQLRSQLRRGPLTCSSVSLTTPSRNRNTASTFPTSKAMSWMKAMRS